MSMQTSAAGIDLIKRYEGFGAKRYICPAGLPTIGYGHVILAGEKFPAVMTKTQAEKLLALDLKKYEAPVNKLVRVPLTQGQFDALVSFVYNIGAGKFQSSTLLKMLNLGDYAGARGQFMRWNKANGQVLAGLTARRAAEANLFGGM